MYYLGISRGSFIVWRDGRLMVSIVDVRFSFLFNFLMTGISCFFGAFLRHFGITRVQSVGLGRSTIIWLWDSFEQFFYLLVCDAFVLDVHRISLGVVEPFKLNSKRKLSLRSWPAQPVEKKAHLKYHLYNTMSEF